MHFAHRIELAHQPGTPMLALLGNNIIIGAQLAREFII